MSVTTRTTCSTELDKQPWVFDLPATAPKRPLRPSYGPGASQWDVAPPSSPLQGAIPDRYKQMDPAELDRRIAAARAALGPRLVILGHHYQRDEIIRFADFRGDTFKLSQWAAEPPGGRLHRLLRRPLHGRERRHPQRRAPEGDPAQHGRRLLDGRHGRTSTTSTPPGRSWTRSAAPATRHPGHLHELGRRPQGVLRRERRHRLHLQQRQRGPRVGLRARRAGPLLPRPAPRPQHRPPRWASRSTDASSGTRACRSAATRRGELRAATRHPLAGPLLRPPALQRARRSRRPAREHPGINVVVHPECRYEVVQAADLDGSTEFIIETIAPAPRPARRGRSAPRSTWCSRLAGRAPGQDGLLPRPGRSAPARRCTASTRPTSPGCWRRWSTATSSTRSRSTPRRRHHARIALDRMLALA